MHVDLPEPGPEQRAHGARVAEMIHAEIAAAGGAIDFERYMELALYAPGLGYYSAGAEKFGAAGDFVTAPGLGFLFARCVARALAPVLRASAGDVLECGPGSGALACDLLLELERLDALPRRYRLLERSADLRERQRAALHRHCPHLEYLAEWIDKPPQAPWRGVLVANEVVDALPARLFAWRDAGLFARAVASDGDAFVWCERAADPALAAAVERALGRGLDALPRPYRSEVCTLLAPWFAAATRTLGDGAVLIGDYGYARTDYYAAQRREGTLRCHYRHRAHGDPLVLAGLQDITVSVDFDALGAAARAAGFGCRTNLTQAQFLIEHGLDAVFTAAYASAGDEAARFRLAQEAKQLTLPGAMGERFRMLVFERTG